MDIRKLKAIRVENGYTQAQLAERLGISAKTYNRKELGIIEFTQNELLNLSTELKLTLNLVNEIFFENKLTKCTREYSA